MKVRELIDKLNLYTLTDFGGLENEVTGAYSCDLLSWVMSHANKGNVWITVQVHPNIIAVATLLDLSCIIIPERIQVESITLQKANEHGIPVLQCQDCAYEICGELKRLGI